MIYRVCCYDSHYSQRPTNDNQLRLIPLYLTVTYAKSIRFTALLLDFELLLLTVRMPSFVMRQDVFLRLAVHNVDVLISQIDRLDPITGGINDYRDASTCHAARDQHRHQACG